MISGYADLHGRCRLGNKINFGIDFHYQEVTAFDDYFDEPLKAWNLATSRSFIHYVNFSTFTALPIPNNPAWTGTPGVFNNDTNYSKVFTVAPFYEHVFDFGEHFSLLAGVRADVAWVKVNDPLYDEAIAAGTVNPNGRVGARASVVESNSD